ncbi:MAG: hypothetical protein EBY16_09885, partial [Gammaproteobacteria bacterium]|nr:hypothetical protein [Gammaproteobacteria bacterium]
ERVFCTENDTLYLTEDNIEQWAMDTSKKRKILFIDEANLSPRQWSEFEGLYQTPPHILVNGNLHLLAPNHQVIFAGNPVNYGDERRLAPFFERHGNAVLFEPLPPALIAEQILTPVFQNTGIDPRPIIDRILDVYGFICACSTTDILISPRELQMMALLTVTRAQKYPEQDINAIAEHFTYQLAINLLPIEKRGEFDERFKPKTPITIALPETTDQAFHVTPSRQAVSQQLNDLLALRNWRREEKTLSPQQKTGGLGGIIIEGEPGIGKSQLVIAALIASKYEQEHDLTTPSRKENPFYIMPVSMPLSEKENLLIKAFNEGAIVMIDEINSSPMMERLLNDLLMGKNPKRKPDDVVKPGFMIIGTQNPVTMAGRRAASTALLRRVISTTLPEYEPAEIGHILKNKGVPAPVADDMMTAYEKKRAHAIKNLLSPVPNFRHLMTLVDYYLESRRPGLALEQSASFGEEEKRLPSLGR